MGLRQKMDLSYLPQIASALDLYKDLPHLEIEVRLGRIIGTKFVAGITEGQFAAVERTLSSNPKWTSVIRQEFIDCYGKVGRLRTSNTGRDVTAAIKKKLYVCDIRGKCGIDVRFCISQEIPLPVHEFQRMPFEELKERTQRIHKFWSFDTTRITKGASLDKDSDSKVEYHAEVELMDVSRIRQTSSQYIAEYALLLANDLIKMIS